MRKIKSFKKFGWGVTLAAFVALSACGGSSSTSTTEEVDTTSVPTSAPITSTLAALVTNDDGITADGIDVLVNEVKSDASITFEVWAPAENQSGTGDSTTAGGVLGIAAFTKSGVAGQSVAGFPADSVLAALAAGVKINVVLSGINKGQNIGPLVKISGTVGAAATAARKGYWALAVSQGIADAPAFDTAAPLVAQWLAQYRADILAGKPARLFNLNVPTCATGTLRPLVVAPVASEIKGRQTAVVNCDGPDLANGVAIDDVDAFMHGHAVLSELNPITLANVK